MIQKELRRHQRKEFLRNPMFDRNLGIKIFMFFMFGIIAAEMLSLGFVLDKILLESGSYERAIDTFNSIILYIFAVDFIIKFIFKSNQSMQIAPYLTLPVKRNTLFNFLLTKEFTSLWNLYLLFLVVPFAFKAIAPFYGFITPILYILFFYLSCILNSLIISFANNFVKRSLWYNIPVLAAVILPVVFSLTGKLDLGAFTQRAGESLLNNNLLVWIALIALLIVFWTINQKQMRGKLYRELQGEKVEKIGSFSKLSFFGQFGEIGDWIQLEIRLILRAKRLKSQFFAFGYFLVLYIFMLYKSKNSLIESNPVYFSVFGIIVVGYPAIVYGQFIFPLESSFFDGLMARNASIQNMLKGKYIFYSSYSLIISLLLLIPVFQGKLSLLYVVANFFYLIGPVFFVIFWGSIYNKTYLDIFSSGWMNWQGQSGSMTIISMLILVPVTLIYIIFIYFGKAAAYWFMLIVGILFTLTSQQWLRWTYNRFLKRKYKNMEGFRIES